MAIESFIVRTESAQTGIPRQRDRSSWGGGVNDNHPDIECIAVHHAEGGGICKIHENRSRSGKAGDFLSSKIAEFACESVT